jgi:hypothetical protein
MEHGPSDDAIEAMADSQPHKWTAAIRQLSMIAGFADRSEHLEVRAIVDMSDSQLEAALRLKLDALRGQGLTIEGVAEEPLVAEKAHK